MDMNRQRGTGLSDNRLNEGGQNEHAGTCEHTHESLDMRLMAEVDFDFLDAYERIYELTAVREGAFTR